MDEPNETDRKKKEKRIDLSLAQVAGSALAAAAAAYLAGQLGVYGTIIGAGLISVVATTGGSIFQHLFRRTGEQIKEATVTTRPRPRRSASTDPRSTTGAGAHAPRTMVLPTFDRQGAPDDVTAVAAKNTAPVTDRTRVLPQAAHATRPYRRGPAADRRQLVPRLDARSMALGQAEPRTDEDAAEATAVLPGAGHHTHAGHDGHDGNDAHAGRVARPEEISTTTYGTRLRGWKRPALGALAVFVLAMGGVTATELLTGETPSGQKGTTLSNLTGVGGAGRHHPGRPASPDPGRSTGNGTHGGTGKPSPQPSGSGSDRQSPEPTPSDGGGSSPDTGSSPSTGPSPDHSSGSGGDTGGGSADDRDQGGQSNPPAAEQQQAPQPDPS
ncbi:hypothetical protein [Streptomyces natalensis]|uniref:Uncharacterized protein n=1 Tax=Streptomyces natalensis ATCC 27448 TaxID=1240678 RepID=A0A0D7CEI6_9ACTN|nr:hypothetical protein [Streptomyces natalensis]KIZ14633.1 hypothetical protein SNA_31535 [Streptomyces natalensis ATCC 27448]